MQLTKSRTHDLGSLRTIEVEPLHQVATVLFCQHKFGSGLDSFGYHSKTQIVRQSHDAGEQLPALFIARRLHKESAIDLDLIDRHVVQVTE